MRLALDTDVLVNAHLPGLERHRVARSFLLDHLSQPVTLVVTPLVLHEWVHVVTDSRRFEPAVEMSEALEIAKGYLDRDNIDCLPVGEDAFLLATDLLARHRLGRRRVADTLLAATLLSAGVHHLATFNRKDYAIFDNLQIIDPEG